jgi:glycosyltransferase involved in cell wall biosynthesis
MLSILILTFNEEQNIIPCLQSVAWSDDVLVLDSFSTDQTVPLAQRAGVRILQNPFENFAQQRNFGLTHGQLKHPWVLHLDADERVTPELQRELLKVTRDGAKDAYRVASRMMFQGKWLRYSGLYPWYQVRVGRRDKLRFIQTGHGQREDLPPDLIGMLSEDLLHYSFSKGLADWFDKHNRYSSAEARHFVEAHGQHPIDWTGLIFQGSIERKRTLKRIFAQLPCRPTLRFLYMYFLRRGFLDGRAGLTYCRMLRIYEYMTVLKIKEQESRPQ